MEARNQVINVENKIEVTGKSLADVWENQETTIEFCMFSKLEGTNCLFR